jgi:hypothetical protein
MNTGKLAEEYVKEYFKKKQIKLIKAPKGELGYDFRNRDSDLFVEVKGTAAKDLTKVLFRRFTNTEYEKARACLRAKQTYEVHLIVGIGGREVQHFVIPGKTLLERAKPEVTWSLPIRKEFHKYRVGSPAINGR